LSTCGDFARLSHFVKVVVWKSLIAKKLETLSQVIHFVSWLFWASLATHFCKWHENHFDPLSAYTIKIVFHLYYDIKALYEIDFLNNECGCIIVLCHVHDVKRKKPLNIKFKDGNPSIKSTKQMKAQIDTSQKKENKNKQSTKIR